MREVVVQRGDTLEGIAARELGDRRRWPALFQMNEDRIASDPRCRAMLARRPRSSATDWVFPGQRLRVPSRTRATPALVAVALAAALLAPVTLAYGQQPEPVKPAPTEETQEQPPTPAPGAQQSPDRTVDEIAMQLGQLAIANARLRAALQQAEARLRECEKK